MRPETFATLSFCVVCDHPGKLLVDGSMAIARSADESTPNLSSEAETLVALVRQFQNFKREISMFNRFAEVPLSPLHCLHLHSAQLYRISNERPLAIDPSHTASRRSLGIEKRSSRNIHHCQLVRPLLLKMRVSRCLHEQAAFGQAIKALATPLRAR